MRFALVIFAVGLLPGVVSAQAPDPVFLEELTWTEVRDALATGATTVIIPTGGTEQNGLHMVLGKHNYLVGYKAGEVARRLGSALVAPVMAYVPEGDVDPPSGRCLTSLRFCRATNVVTASEAREPDALLSGCYISLRCGMRVGNEGSFYSAAIGLQFGEKVKRGLPQHLEGLPYESR